MMRELAEATTSFERLSVSEERVECDGFAGSSESS